MHTRRGQEAFDAFGILPGFQGTAIHDGWAPYRKDDCLHGLCNAHHLWELKCIHELYGQRWAKNMIDLLVAANRDVADGPLGDDRMVQINADYTTILAKGDTIHPIKKRKDGSAHLRQSTPANLLRRLREYREDVLHFLSDPEVPFTNNIAEQAVRMPKVKQKISSCFRTFDGQPPSARSDPIWKPCASRASTCCTRWFTLFRGKPCSPPWGNCTPGEQLRYSMPPAEVSDVL